MFAIVHLIEKKYTGTRTLQTDYNKITWLTTGAYACPCFTGLQ